MVTELWDLFSRWFDVLAKSEKLGIKRRVHIAWERGSIYFDGVKINLLAADANGEPCSAGLALSQVVYVL